MRSAQRILAVTAILAGMLTSTVVQAACTQANLQGFWQSYIVSGETFWTRCLLVINAAGVVQNTSCVDASGTVRNLTAGKITLLNANFCIYRGSVTVAGFVFTIRHLTLARDKISGYGVGTVAGGTFILSMTKI